MLGRVGVSRGDSTPGIAGGLLYVNGGLLTAYKHTYKLPWLSVSQNRGEVGQAGFALFVLSTNVGTNLVCKSAMPAA